MTINPFCSKLFLKSFKVQFQGNEPTFIILDSPIRFLKSFLSSVIVDLVRSGTETKTPNAASKHTPPMISKGKIKPPISYKKDPTAGPKFDLN